MRLSEEIQGQIKKQLGHSSAALVEQGMLVGLGSGSTASCFIESLGARCSQGLKIQAVASSERSLALAHTVGIPTLSMDSITQIDLTVDGADEVDPHKRLIKGGGGAHVREKIVAAASCKVVIIVDEAKMVSVLGKCHLPVEILPFGFGSTIARLKEIGYEGRLRKTKEGALYITDNGNYLYDIDSPGAFPDPRIDHECIVSVAGVVDTGFFFDLPLSLLIGYADGRVESVI